MLNYVRLLAAIVALLSFGSVRAYAELPPFGVELEFARESSLESDVSKIPVTAYTGMAQAIQGVYGGRGTIRTQIFERYRNKGAQEAIYTDPMGREWSVVPESVNTTGLDGLEMVSPVLTEDKDISQLQSVFRHLENNGEYSPGVRSSMHVTVDVSNLFDKAGDASKLVDTILYIENHWSEIYSALSPNRYGTVVNRFSVPLAAEQRALLNELSALPKAERTYERVREIFARYEAMELQLKDGSSNKAWKYRAANYKKLFGLQGTPQLSVIEFRIADFASPDEIPNQIQLLRKIIANAHNLEPGAKFQDPFKGVAKDSGEHFDNLNQRISELPESKYQAFLKQHGYTANDFPKLGRLRGPPSFGLAGDAINQAIAKINPREPVKSQSGHAITYGFEAEFKGLGEYNVLSSRGMLGVGMRIRDEFKPFLEAAHREGGTGNAEVNSKPSDKMGDIFPQMKQVREALGGAMRGFHLHIRVPKEMVASVGDREFKSWVSRMGDYISAWRLENKHTYWALNTWSNVRNAPDTLNERGTIRMEQGGQGSEAYWDIELRGFMTEVEEIQKLAEIITVGAQNPEMIRGFADTQEKMFAPRKSLEQTIEEHMARFNQRVPTAEEREILNLIQKHAVDNVHHNSTGQRGHLPLMGFEDAAFLTPLQARRFKDAQFNFNKGVVTILKNWREGKYGKDKDELYKQYRYRIKKWAEEADLQATLGATLLMPPSQQVAADVSTPAGIQAMLVKGDKETLDAVAAHAKSLPPAERNKLFAFLLKDLRPSVRARALEIFSKQESPDHAILTSALGDTSAEVRKKAVEYFDTNRNAQNERVLQDALTHGARPQQRAGLIEALASYGMSDANKPIFQAASQDPNSMVRLAVARAAVSIGENPSTVGWIKEALRDNDPEVQTEAMQSLLKFKSEEAARAVVEQLTSGSAELKAKLPGILLGMSPDQISHNLAVEMLKSPLPKLGLLERFGGNYWDPISQMKRDFQRTAIQKLAQAEGPIDAVIVRQALQSPDVETRKVGARLVGRVPGEEAGQLFDQAIKDGDNTVRHNALASLKGRADGDGFSGSALLAVLEYHIKNGDYEMRRGAVLALVGREDARSAALLVEAINNSGWDKKTRAEAERVMLTRKDSYAFPTILSLALEHSDASIRASAMSALATHSDTARLDAGSAAKLVEKVALSGVEGQAAAVALIQSLEKNEALVTDAISRNPDFSVRAKLLTALASAGDSLKAKAEGIALRSMQDGDVRVIEAAFSLFKTTEGELKAVLSSMLSLNESARAWGAKTLEGMDISEVPAERLAKAFENVFTRGTGESVDHATTALAGLGERALPLIEKWMKSGDANLRRRAVEALGQLSQHAGAGTLLGAALESTEPAMRLAAVRAGLQTPSANQEIVEKMRTHADEAVRLEALRVAGERKDAAGRDILIKHLQSTTSPKESAIAAKAIVDSNLAEPAHLATLSDAQLLELLRVPGAAQNEAIKKGIQGLSNDAQTGLGDLVVRSGEPALGKGYFGIIKDVPVTGSIADVYRKALTHGDVEVANAAFDRLKGLSKKEHLFNGISAMFAGADEAMRTRGANYLKRLASQNMDGDAEKLYLKTVSRALTSTDPAIQAAAQEILRTRTTPGTVKLLRALLTSSDPDVRKAAAPALVGNTQAEHLPVLKAAAGSTDPLVREAGITGLYGRSDDASVQARNELGLPSRLGAALQSIGQACLDAYHAVRRPTEPPAQPPTGN